jgi:hypothetical protein
MKSRVFVFTLVVTVLVFSLGFAAGEKIAWWSVNAGGNIYSSSTNYRSCGSVTQSVAGEVAGDSHRAYVGFWTPWLSSTDVEQEEEMAVPLEFSLSQNYPNPFNPQTVIEYNLRKESHVKITVYNVLGQKVRILRDEIEEGGHKRVVWDGRDDSGNEVTSGIYFYKIVAGDFAKAKKMIMVK